MAKKLHHIISSSDSPTDVTWPISFVNEIIYMSYSQINKVGKQAPGDGGMNGIIKDGTDWAHLGK